MPAPSTPSLAYKLETLAIDMLSEHESLAGVSIVHQSEDSRADINRIVCTATLGEQEHGGVRPWNVSLEVRAYVTERDAGKIEDYSKAIDETFTTFPAVDSLSDFEYLVFLGEEEEEKDEHRESRQRGKTYNFHASEAVPIPAPTGLELVQDDTTVTVSWGSVEGAESYELLFDGDWINVGSALTYLFADVPGGTYTVEVRAVRAGGVRGYSAAFPQFHIASLARWFDGGIAGKSIVMCGDSTTEIAPSFYTRIAFHQYGGEGLEGVMAIHNKGSNGQTAAGYMNDFRFSDALALNGDLYVVCFLINDVRLGGLTLETAVARLRAIVERIRSVVPTADIVLRVPNSLLTDDPTATGWVVPLASAQAYTDLMREAYMQLRHVWPNVVVWDAMEEIFGTVCGPKASRPLMNDILHPSTTGYTALANRLVGLIGDAEQFDATQAEAARAANYALDYTVYHYAPLDPGYYDQIAVGQFNAQGPGFFDIDWPGARAAEIQFRDVVVPGDRTPWPITGVPAGSNLNTTVTRIGMTAPSTMDGGTVRVMRHKYAHDQNIQAYRQGGSYPYQWRGRVIAAGNGFIDLGSFTTEKLAKDRTATVSADTLIVAGVSPRVLTGATFAANGNNLRIARAGIDFTGQASKLFWIFGNHAYEDGSTVRAMDPTKNDVQTN